MNPLVDAILRDTNPKYRDDDDMSNKSEEEE